MLALVVRAADTDRIAAEERREHRGGHPDVDTRHPLAHPGDVVGTATHAPELLVDEQQLDAELLAAHAPHDLGRKLVVLVELDQERVGELTLGELRDRVESHLERVDVQTLSHRSPSSDTPSFDPYVPLLRSSRPSCSSIMLVRSPRLIMTGGRPGS